MNFIISANTDVGIVKPTNQDSLSVMVLKTPLGRMAFGILCDGMGGLDKGEVASASVTRAFREWAIAELPLLCKYPLEDAVIRKHWERIIVEQNQLIKDFSVRHGVRMGTTVVVMLLTQSRYYILNVGDSRAYRLTGSIQQLTTDQTVMAREIAMGRITEKEAETDPRRNVLLQCVGASDEIFPEMTFGDVESNAVYMLCSDGFRHEITSAEIYDRLQPNRLLDERSMQSHAQFLIELNKQRLERDNISVVLVRTF